MLVQIKHTHFNNLGYREILLLAALFLTFYGASKMKGLLGRQAKRTDDFYS